MRQLARWRALSCTTCHTAFDPGTTGFDHLLEREVRGSWVESGAGFGARPPTLGIRVVTETNGQQRNLVDTFVPGMVLTIGGAGGAERGGATRFRRLYARTFSHTVSARSRACVSCHNDPVALGYGRGSLTYERAESGGRWHFIPGEPLSPFDGLPNDAWIGFLEVAAGSRSTRDDVRPFSADEQKRILTAGACLTCHAPESTVMRGSLEDFDGVLRGATPSCRLPVWSNR